MSFNSQKGEFDRLFNRLDRPVEESRPDRQPDRPVDPTGRLTQPVSISGLGASPPDFHSLRRLVPPSPTPVWDTFKLYKFPRRVSCFRHFRYLTLGLSPLPLAKFWLSAKTRLCLLIFHFAISSSHKKFFWKVLMTSLHAIFGLGHPQSKTLATPMLWR